MRSDTFGMGKALPLYGRHDKTILAEVKEKLAGKEKPNFNGPAAGLPYTKDGYRLLGERFAAKTIEPLNAKP